MAILKLLIFFGVVEVVYNTLIQWAVFFPINRFLSEIYKENFDKIIFPIRLFNQYLHISICALALLKLMNTTNTVGKIFLVIISLLLIIVTRFFCLINRPRDAKADRKFELAYEYEKNMPVDLIIFAGSSIFFIVLLFFPFLGTNMIVNFVYKIILLVFELPLINWIVGAWGGGLMIYNLFTTFFYVMMATLAWKDIALVWKDIISKQSTTKL